ncbi:MAG: hypothetical protein PHF84_09565 [bacterium]|nr:hypothetical protein [bacterium]
MDPKKIITGGLALFVVLVWGLAVKRFADTQKPGTETNVSVKARSMNDLSEKLRKKLDILGSGIDLRLLPAVFGAGTSGPAGTKDGTSRPSSAGQNRITAPPYSLQGIVWDEKEPRAILVKLYRLDANDNSQKENSTFIIKPGDKIDYGEVLSITREYVMINIKNIKFKLWSNRWERSE